MFDRPVSVATDTMRRMSGVNVQDSSGTITEQRAADSTAQVWGYDRRTGRYVFMAPGAAEQFRADARTGHQVRTLGDATATAHRRPYYVEFLAYLALHPSGVTAEKLAADLCIRPQKARSDLSIIRKWLGQSRAGKPYLPRAQQTHQDGVPATYALDGVLCDLDLFRRLRARGQSRGADGMADLVSALHLVSGEPFTDLRKDGWGWLLEGDRLDHIMTAAIVDVGHIVTTHALTAGDLELADFASNVALAASPYDEIANLDRAAVERATGDVEGADTRMRNDVFNRTDDELGPIQLAPRTAEVVERERPTRTGRRTG